MTECPKCKGYGIVGSAVPDILRGRGAIFSSNECDMCHGSGEVEMTNEEWLRQASTEELEKMFEKAQDYGATCSNGDKDKCSYCGCPWCEMGFSTWLNEKHK